MERQLSMNYVKTKCQVDQNNSLESLAASFIDPVDKFKRLQDILEDYLEIRNSGKSISANINKYNSIEILSKYFRIVQIELGDIVYDIGEEPDSVMTSKNLFNKRTNVVFI